MRNPIVVLLVLALCSASSARAAAARVRVFVSQSADVLYVRDSIAALGGTIRGFAPERAFVVDIDDSRFGAVAAVQGVAVLKVIPPPRLPVSPPVPRFGAIPDAPASLATAILLPVVAVAPNTLAQERAKLAGTLNRPPAADNSLSVYFPPVQGQLLSDCVAWAVCYYYSTYTQARDENVDVSVGIGDLQAAKYTGSPSFLYPLINYGADAGASGSTAVGRLNEVGCASQAVLPYSTDYLTWPSQQSWLDALKFRTAGPRKTIDVSVAGNLEALKQYLANGNVAVTGTEVYGNWTSYPNNVHGVDNGVLFSTDGEQYVAGHEMTIVGYDDNRPFNDGTSNRRGAFLVVNSWGNNWGAANSSGTDHGFLWVAYDYAVLPAGNFKVSLFNDDRDHYRPRLYAAAGLSHPERAHLAYSGGLGSVTAPEFISYFPIQGAGGAAEGIDASKPVVVDLTDGIAQMDSVDTMFVNLFTGLGSPFDGKILSTTFFHDFGGNGQFSQITSSDPPVTVTPGSQGFAKAPIRISTLTSLVGDKDNFHPGDAADVPPRSQRVRDILTTIASSPGQNPGVDLDTGEIYGSVNSRDRPVGLSHEFAIPGKSRVTKAGVKIRLRGNDPLVYNDVILFNQSSQGVPGAPFLPFIALRDLLKREPVVGEVMDLQIDLGNVPVRLVESSGGPGGHLSPSPDEFRNLLPLLQQGQLDLIFEDDVSVDYSELTVTFVSATAPKGDLNGDDKIDLNDLNIIMGALNTNAYPGDPRDLNTPPDGRIDVLDARILVTKCTKPGCVTQ